MTARTTARHRAEAGTVAAVTGRRRRDPRDGQGRQGRRPGRRRAGPPLFVAALLAVSSAALTTTTEAVSQAPGSTTSTGTAVTVDR